MLQQATEHKTYTHLPCQIHTHTHTHNHIHCINYTSTSLKLHVRHTCTNWIQKFFQYELRPKKNIFISHIFILFFSDQRRIASLFWKKTQKKHPKKMRECTTYTISWFLLKVFQYFTIWFVDKMYKKQGEIITWHSRFVCCGKILFDDFTTKS